MNGPEHYREAELLIERAGEQWHDNGPGCGSEETIAAAQVHATLALAAATATGGSGAGSRWPHDRPRWHSVLNEASS